MEDLWWLLAICSSIMTGITIYANQIFKMPSSLMMTYRGLVQSFILLMFAPFFTMPQSPWFWILGIIQGLLIAYADKKTFLASRLYGGEVVGSLKPYVISLVFVIWLIIKPSQLVEMWEHPLNLGTIVICLIAIVFALRALCKGKASKEAFFMMLPAFICTAFIDVNNKYTTTEGASSGLVSAIFYYCLTTAFVCGIPNAIKFFKHRDWHLAFAPKYILGGMLIILCNILGNISKNTAMYYADNPAYVSAVMSLYPVWIILWNYYYYHCENVEKFPKCNIKAAAALLTSIIVLILAQSK